MCYHTLVFRLLLDPCLAFNKFRESAMFTQKVPKECNKHSLLKNLPYLKLNLSKTILAF